MDKQELRLRVRDLIEDDLPFLYSSLLKSHRYSRQNIGTQNEIYFTSHHKLVSNMIKNCKVIVLCSQDDLSQIYGYGIAEVVDGIFTVHFIYVKHPYRGLGLAKLIFKHLGGAEGTAFCYTHRTKRAEEFEIKHSTGVYHPYLAFKYYGEPNGESKNQEEKEEQGGKPKKEKAK